MKTRSFPLVLFFLRVCNLFSARLVQCTKRRYALPLAFLLMNTCAPAGAASADTNTAARAEAVIQQIQNGNLPGAALSLRAAMEAEPNAPLLHDIAGTLLLLTGDTNGALSEFQNALNELPGDSLAFYGLSLAHLARAEQSRSMDYLELAERNGDRIVCLVARRYLEGLNGAVGVGEGLTLPDTFASSALTLSGMAAMRRGDHRTALKELTEALNGLTGDATAEPNGLCMSFDRAVPIRFGNDRLPTGHGLVRTKTAGEKPFNGVVTLTAKDFGGDVGYVVYKVDGAVSLVNVAPFQLVWDTATVPNGLHTIDIIAYDRSGQQIGQNRKTLRTANAGAPARQAAQADRSEQIRSTLWNALILRPSRVANAYSASEASHLLGDNRAAADYLRTAAAVDAGYRDIRPRLMAMEREEGCIAGEAIWRGAASDNVIALTFDDGPKAGYTEQLLAILTRERVPATFFVIGRHTTAHPELARKIVDAGMEIENHSYTHSKLTLLPEDAVERELLRTNAAIYGATGKRVRYFRPPGGNMNGTVAKVAARWGLTPCMWTTSGDAMENVGADRLVQFVLQQAKPGGIVILHNGRDSTVAALPRIIEGLRQRGYSFVTVEQMAQRKRQITGAQ